MRHLCEWPILAENRWPHIGRKLTIDTGNPINFLIINKFALIDSMKVILFQELFCVEFMSARVVFLTRGIQMIPYIKMPPGLEASRCLAYEFVESKLINLWKNKNSYDKIN